MRGKQRLPESELDIMLAVWTLGEEATAPAILGRLERPLTASALHSYLRRLEEKGFLRCEKGGKVNHYTAIVSQREYQRQESRTVLGKLYQGSLCHFAAALHDGGGLDREEAARLRAYLEELERRAGE